MRTSLAVGFADGTLPLSLERFRGRDHRSIANMPEFPYEDAQFEVVMLDRSVVSAKAVREAHRVLRADGRLFFIVPEKTSRQDGFALPDVYSIVRDGFDVVGCVRPPWWRFGRNGHTLSITARKKAWRPYRGLESGETVALSIFARRT